MIAGIYISQEILAIDMLTVLKSSLENDRKHVRLLAGPLLNLRVRGSDTKVFTWEWYSN